MISGAAVGLLCFFMPWLGAGWSASSEAYSGLALARRDPLLWIVPGAMLAVIALALPQGLRARAPILVALSASVGGGVSFYLMNRARLGIELPAALVPIDWSMWYWMGQAAALAVVVAAFVFYFDRVRSGGR